MNADTFKGQWKQLAGRAREQWGKLTDDDLQRVEGNLQRFEGIVQERYGLEREEARRQIDSFLDRQGRSH